MLDTICRLIRSRISLLVVIVAGLVPEVANAEMVKVVNNTSFPVVIQASVLIRGVPRRDRPYQVPPGAEVTLNLPMVGDRVLTVTDGRNPNLTLLQSIVPNSPADPTNPAAGTVWSLSSDGPRGVRLQLLQPQTPSR